jgi:hypothetical protein
LIEDRAVESALRFDVGAGPVNLADVSDWDLEGDLVFKGSADLTDEQKVAVAEVVQERARDGGRTLKLKLYDKLSAMAHLAKLLNLLVDRQEISGPNGGPVEVTDHRARIMDRLNAIAKRQAPDDDGASGSACHDGIESRNT